MADIIFNVPDEEVGYDETVRKIASGTPIYDELFDKVLTRNIGELLEMMSLCVEMRGYFQTGATQWTWYYYKEDIRKVFDAISLVEHDLFLLTHQLTRIYEANLKLLHKSVVGSGD